MTPNCPLLIIIFISLTHPSIHPVYATLLINRRLPQGDEAKINCGSVALHTNRLYSLVILSILLSYRWPQSMQIIHVVVTLWSPTFHSHLYYRWTFNIHIVSAALLMWTFGCQEMNRTWTECVAILNKSPTMPTNHSIFTWHWNHRPFSEWITWMRWNNTGRLQTSKASIVQM